MLLIPLLNQASVEKNPILQNSNTKVDKCKQIAEFSFEFPIWTNLSLPMNKAITTSTYNQDTALEHLEPLSNVLSGKN